MTRHLNIASYLFARLDDLLDLQRRIKSTGKNMGIRGNTLIAAEGINMVIAGEASAMRLYWNWLTAQPGLAKLHPKESWSELQPFNRMSVRIKREIIRMNEPDIDPIKHRASSVDALTLQRWIEQGHDDTGKPIFLLDTRNAFEVHQGTLKGAHHLDLDFFSQFPERMKLNTPIPKDVTTVAFCTGGIRCEKAVLWMNEQGYHNVHQLDGGILTYLERVRDTPHLDPHYEGNCFVFDGRIAVSPTLEPATEAASKKPIDSPTYRDAQKQF